MTAKRHLHLGDQLAWTFDDLDGGLEHYRKALEIDPTLAMAHWRIGQVHLFATPPRTEEAIAAFRKAVGLEPKWSLPHAWLGFGLLQNKLFKEAIKEHQTAIVLSEKEDERLYISLGDCYFGVRKYAEAIAAYQNGMRVARGEMAVYSLRLGNALHANKQNKQACVQWRRALELCFSDEREGEVGNEARSNIEKYCAG